MKNDETDKIKSNDWVVVNTSLSYKITGGIVCLSINAENTNKQWQTIGTIPSDICPPTLIYNCFVYKDGTYANGYISKTGVVQVLTYSTTSHGYICYPL